MGCGVRAGSCSFGPGGGVRVCDKRTIIDSFSLISIVYLEAPTTVNIDRVMS